MKTSAFAVIAVVALIFITAVSFRPVVKLQAPKNIPDSVFAVLHKSCVPCHANDGNKMAASKLNFDNWDNYSPDRMASKADAISNMLKKDKMPPNGFRKNNPNLVPTEADKAKVVTWAGSFGK